MRKKQMCGAHAISTGQPCRAKALGNGRGKNHGGMSTGPRTVEGKLAVAQATATRMACGQKERALEGFQAWLAEVVRNTCETSPNSDLSVYSRRKRSRRLVFPVQYHVRMHLGVYCLINKMRLIPEQSAGLETDLLNALNGK